MFNWNLIFFIIDAKAPKYKQDGASSPEKNAGKTGTILSEDYAEIVDEEGDYSTPASKYPCLDHPLYTDVLRIFIFHL